MIDKRTIWQQALGGLAEDFFDLFLSPAKPFPDDVSYPETPGMEALINDRFDSLYLPDKRLVNLGELIEENLTEQDERRLADWAALFEWEVLNGFGDEAALSLDGISFEGLRNLAVTWGSYLTQTMNRMLRMWEIYEVVGDTIARMFRQLPARELGEAMRESFTPGYLRAHASVKYATALFSQDQRALREAEEVLQASDADLSSAIAIAMSGMSSLDLGSHLKRVMMDLATLWGEIFSSQDFKERFPNTLSFAFQGLAWYMGYCFRQRLQNNPRRAKRILESIKSHKEVHAAVEEYKWLHSWGGDRNKAVDLGWQSVAPKFFGLSGRIENIKEDEDQEKLIGVANALEGYCRDNPAIVGVMDGVSAGVGAYLAKGGKNQETSWYRKQRTEGNKTLTEAEHPQTKDVVGKTRSAAEEEVEELSDDEILSRLKERHDPSGDPVLREMEAKESSIGWHGSLTEREKTAANLKLYGYSEEEIAREMGISQQRVSQLVRRASEKRRSCG